MNWFDIELCGGIEFNVFPHCCCNVTCWLKFRESNVFIQARNTLSWFHEIFFHWEWIYRFFYTTLCIIYLEQCYQSPSLISSQYVFGTLIITSFVTYFSCLKKLNSWKLSNTNLWREKWNDAHCFPLLLFNRIYTCQFLRFLESFS